MKSSGLLTHYRNYYLRLFILIAFGLTFTECSYDKIPTQENIQKQLPNIVFILADDLWYGDLSCYNKESKIPTPILDKLAEEGMRFTDAHTPTAVCSPTRNGVFVHI